MDLRALDDLLDLVLARACAVCSRPGRSVCGSCAAEVLALTIGFGGPRPVRPVPCPPSLPRCVAAAPYAGPLASLVTAHKDEGRRDVRPVLACLLAGSIARVLSSEPGPAPVLVVPAPGSAAARRRRGGDPLADLAAAALRLLPVAAERRPDLLPVDEGRRPDLLPVDAERRPDLLPALRHTRRVRDQAGLPAAARRENLGGAVALRRGVDVAGRTCLLVDDVVTTGATLAECARALSAGGATILGAATVCATSRWMTGHVPRLSPSRPVG